MKYNGVSLMFMREIRTVKLCWNLKKTFKYIPGDFWFTFIHS